MEHRLHHQLARSALPLPALCCTVIFLYCTCMYMHVCITIIQCNLNYPDPFVHRLILAHQVSETVRITEVPTFLT